MNFGGRGYTGHEHLNQFGLINMNARLYDPVLARFLAPDPLVGSGMTNDFNRYIYCRNNPLMYTDPSGESWKSFWQDFGNAFVRDFKRTFGGIDGFEIGFSSGGGGFMHATRGGAPFGSSVNYNWKQQKNVDYNQIVSQAAYEGINSSYNETYIQDKSIESDDKNDLAKYLHNYENAGGVKGLDIIYGAFSNEYSGGVEIFLTYTQNEDLTGAWFKQQIKSNYGRDVFGFYSKGRNVIYLDDWKTRNGKYFTDYEMNRHMGNSGRIIMFEDMPKRPYPSMTNSRYDFSYAEEPTYWNASLYLIHNNSTVLRVNYGFVLYHHYVSVTPLSVFKY